MDDPVTFHSTTNLELNNAGNRQVRTTSLGWWEAGMTVTDTGPDGSLGGGLLIKWEKAEPDGGWNGHQDGRVYIRGASEADSAAIPLMDPAVIDSLRTIVLGLPPPTEAPA